MTLGGCLDYLLPHGCGRGREGALGMVRCTHVREQKPQSLTDGSQYTELLSWLALVTLCGILVSVPHSRP